MSRMSVGAVCNAGGCTVPTLGCCKAAHACRTGAAEHGMAVGFEQRFGTAVQWTQLQDAMGHV